MVVVILMERLMENFQLFVLPAILDLSLNRVIALKPPHVTVRLVKKDYTSSQEILAIHLDRSFVK